MSLYHPDPHPVVAINAPWGTGAFLAGEVRKLGGRPVAIVPPEQQLPPWYRTMPIDTSEYEEVIEDTALSTTVRTLRAMRATHVLTGNEIGVERTDLITDALGLPGNSPVTSQLRRDKGAMAEAAADHGVAAPRSLVTSRLTDAIEWMEWLGGECVLKPLDSAGSDGVSYCTGVEELKAAWALLHGRDNVLGGANTYLIVQEWLRGEQYIGNTVALRGPDGRPRHVVTEIWRDRRASDAGALLPPGSPAHLYDRADLLSTGDHPAIVAFLHRALDALDVRFGPAHCELMATADGRLVLIEVGARPMGTYVPAALQRATGSDHVLDTVTAAMTGRLPHRRSDPLHVSKMTLASATGGVLAEEPLRRILRLASVDSHTGRVVPGAVVPPTTSLVDAAGRLMLVHRERDVIERDYVAARRIEATELYQPLPAANSCTW